MSTKTKPKTETDKQGRERPTDEILDRIQGLLAKTIANGCTEAEASAAADMARKLMFKYNISETALSDKEATYVGEHELKTKGGARYEWQVELLAGLCKVNFCRVLGGWSYDSHEWGKGVKWSATIIGQKNDAELTLYLFHYLFRVIKTLGYRAFREAEKNNDWRAAGYVSHSTTFMRSFCPGAVSSVVEVLKASRRQDEKDIIDPTGMALVVARDAMVEDYYYKKTYGVSKADYERHKEENREAYRMAETAGKAGEPMMEREALAKQFPDNTEAWANYVWGYRAGKQLYEDEKLEAKYASGSLPRPKVRTVRRQSHSRRSYSAGRQGHQINWDLFHSGERAGRTIQITEGISEKSSAGPGVQRIG